MNEETYQTVLKSIIERVSRLENELAELHQFLLAQTLSLERPINKPSPTPTKSERTETDYWEVTCLGNFELRCAGCLIAPCKSRRGQSILKYLLSRPKYTASTAMLIECFWPEAASEASTHNLQMAIYALRRSLRGCGPMGSDDTVLFRNDHYLLNPALSIMQDVDSFRTAYECGQRAASIGQSVEAIRAFEEARARYSGDYLAEPYEEWATVHRVALQDIRLNLLSQLGSLYTQAKEWERAVSCYGDMLAVDCYREDIYRQLMCCYAACGRPAEVKQAYLTCQEYLRRDLCLDLAPETAVLYQQLIQHVAPLSRD
jgi:two-component system, LytTR family, response regulator